MAEPTGVYASRKSLHEALTFRPALTGAIFALTIVSALLEGIGLTFLVPIIEVAQSGEVAGDSQIGAAFESVYAFLGVPFQLETLLIGVGAVIATRYIAAFLAQWLRGILRVTFVRHLRDQTFESLLAADISYFDDHSSDEPINAIVTQTNNGARVLLSLLRFFEQAILSFIYLLVAVIISPLLTVATLVFLGSLVAVIRFLLESGYAIGDRIASANEQVQQATQAGAEGIRDVKLFGLTDEILDRFYEANMFWTDSRITIRRNEAAMDQGYQLLAALNIFVIIYFALRITSTSLAGLGVFLFAIFRLSPRISTLNNLYYKIEGDLPHLQRTYDYIDELERNKEDVTCEAKVPATVEHVEFEDVHFSYPGETVLRGVSFEVERGDFVGFVGHSGAGKSTIISLLARFYEPDQGRITANGTPIDSYRPDEWRDRVSIVRQQPFLFNDTLYFNLTVGNRDVPRNRVEHIAEIAKVTEFLDDLPNGYETELGENGVKLSGGQRQRVAIARALLKEADILVLDEATSDLDTKLEKEVHAAIEEMEGDYATLVIAHRLSTVRNADCIYTMDDGKIVESGSHADLMEIDGKYAELRTVQR